MPLTTPNNNEVIISPDKVILSKTNKKGIIQYANNYFVEVSQYQESEIIGKPHNIIRHPDMPKIIFKVMWEKLHKGENLFAIVKNLTKNGGFYWVVTKFETTYDKNGDILAHYARRKAVPTKVRETAEDIYKMILAIEKHDEKLAEETFYEVLKDHNLTYDELFLEMTGMTEQEVFDYFQSTEKNTNTSNENTILEIENNLEKIVVEKKELSNDFDELTQQVISTKDKLNSNSNHKGFLGSVFDELFDELKKEYKINLKK